MEHSLGRMLAKSDGWGVSKKKLSAPNTNFANKRKLHPLKPDLDTGGSNISFDKTAF